LGADANIRPPANGRVDRSSQRHAKCWCLPCSPFCAACGAARFAPLRWRNADLTGGQLSLVESLEQTKAGLRFKSPKSGKGRTVALSATMVEELKSHRLQRAQDMLKLGVGLSDDDLVIAHPDGSLIQPIYISQNWARIIRKTKLAHLRFHESEACPCYPPPRQRGSSEGRKRAAGALQGGNYARPLQPRDPRNAGGCCRDR
jgi:hypothetical protein